MRYFRKIVGEKCYLSPVNPEDYKQYTEWLNDYEICVNLTIYQMNISIEKEKQFLDMISKSDDQHVYAIVDLEKDVLIGNCGLHDIDYENGTALFGIFIGDKSYWGKGYGKEATRLIIDYAFNILNLDNVMLKVYSFNRRAFELYKKIGFKEFGRLRECRFFAGEKYDEILMDIVMEEFEDSIYKVEMNS